MTRINELELTIKAAQDAYYNGNPVMSDEEFDKIWDELKALDPANEIFFQVGADHTDGFEKAPHQMIMGSQSKANTAEEIDSFASSGEYIEQYKMDGISLELQYINGKFVKAVTRGDGTIGDDITSNVLKMNGLVKSLSKKMTGPIRGEILLKKSVLEEKYPEAKNCRNQASGLSKRKDGAGCENLNIVVYDCQPISGFTFVTEAEKQNFLTAEGFEVAPWSSIKKLDGKTAIKTINDLFDSFENGNNYDYDIDGLIYKQNIIDWDDLNTNYRPKTQIALKRKYVGETVILKDIEWSLKDGTLTPVAIFDKIEILGAEVSRASLSNVSSMEELKIEIGDTIRVIRAGMIIPKVIENITKNAKIKEMKYF